MYKYVCMYVCMYSPQVANVLFICHQFIIKESEKCKCIYIYVIRPIVESIMIH